MANVLSYLFIILALFLPATCIAAEKAPNILFILVDDFGWNDVGFNGSTFYETPRMDALAKEWMRFDQYYTPLRTTESCWEMPKRVEAMDRELMEYLKSVDAVIPKAR